MVWLNNLFIDPTPGRAYILGDANSTQIVRLNEPATIRCLAGGYPKPYVSWWRDTDLLPLQTDYFEVHRDYSLVFNRILLSHLGPYICQAYSGQEKPVSKIVTLKAVAPLEPISDEDRPYLKYTIPNEPVSTPRPYQPRPRPRPRPTPPPVPPPVYPPYVEEPIGK